MSKLKEQAAKYITEAGFKCDASMIDCVQGYWKKEDCYRFEVFNNHRHLGCWITLTEFVKQCKRFNGACIDEYNMEVNPL